MKTLILALLASTLLAPAVLSQKDAHPANSSKDDDVREAVFRYEFKAREPPGRFLLHWRGQ